MATRRSSRLQKQVAQEPVEIQQPAPIEVVPSKKRKAPAAEPDATDKSKKKAPKLTTGKAKGKGKDKSKEPPARTQLPSSNDDLSSLPPEILHMILNSKKQLKKDGKYKGQQERYPSHLDENLKPACADYVRQIVVGVSDPGRKHQYIVHRYLDEAFKNLSNLEIVETRVLTKSMGQSIASLKNLQALSLFSTDFEAGALKPLVKIKNLKHFSLQDHSYVSELDDENNVVRSILLNSLSTLQTLAVETNPYAPNFLKDWEKKISAGGTTRSQNHDLTALELFSLSGVSFDAAFIKALDRAIDFIGLTQLSLGLLSEGQHLFLDHLTSLTSSAQSSGADISLRTLRLGMTNEGYTRAATENPGDLEAKCRFISSFDTLTTLLLPDYNQYPREIATNPGLPTMLLQAIIKHKNLRSLKLSYRGIISDRRIPYLSAATVATIIDALPELEEFEFAPEEAEIDEIGKALARGTNLTTITCFPHDSWAGYPQPAEPGFTILNGIVQGVLSRDGGSGSGSGKFNWEDHSRLKRVSVSYRAWDVGSNFGKAKKRMVKPQKISSEGDGAREVFYQDITRTMQMGIHIGYDPSYEWVERAAGILIEH
ncbi:RNI-like protein [Ilyonectria robusta]